MKQICELNDKIILSTPKDVAALQEYVYYVHGKEK